MPPKAAKEIVPSSSPPQPNKSTPKAPSAGAQPSSKNTNGKKNGKGDQETGGVLAAVTLKNATKMPLV